MDDKAARNDPSGPDAAPVLSPSNGLANPNHRRGMGTRVSHVTSSCCGSDNLLVWPPRITAETSCREMAAQRTIDPARTHTCSSSSTMRTVANSNPRNVNYWRSGRSCRSAAGTCSPGLSPPRRTGCASRNRFPWRHHRSGGGGSATIAFSASTDSLAAVPLGHRPAGGSLCTV